jgi:2-C-methyl-D-erythritol 4-phosphate cytidylyltransferase
MVSFPVDSDNALMAAAPRVVLLVAGGSGQRMGAPVPKQFLPLAGEPVLLHTLRRIYAADPAAQRVLVLPAAEHARWQALLAEVPDVPPHRVVAGGASRPESVRAGLEALHDAPPATLVAIHDGVRPLLTARLLHEIFTVAAARGSAVAAVPLKDSIRRVLPDGGSLAEDRSAFQLVQTPQCFPLHVLRRAYAALGSNALNDPTLTDDASIVARLSLPIALVLGDYTNLKITTPEDLLIAEAFLRAERIS